MDRHCALQSETEAETEGQFAACDKSEFNLSLDTFYGSLNREWASIRSEAAYS